MNKFIKKTFVVLVVFGLLFAALPSLALPSFSTQVVGVGEGWNYGNDDYWNLQLYGEKSTFDLGEKVQLFAQIGPIFKSHEWRLVLTKDNQNYKTITNPRFYPDQQFGWEYSNFVPYETNLPPGNYQAKYELNIDSGFETLETVNFTVNGPSSDYVYDHTFIATGWKYGTGDEYWNLMPEIQKTAFSPGETVYALAQVRDIYVDHKWKVELYRENSFLWNYETNLLNVGDGWEYGNFTPYYQDSKPGSYTFKLYIDTGNGYTLLDSKDFTVSGTVADYVYLSSTIGSDWSYGGGDEYWNISAVDPRTTFSAGERVYIVSKVKNIYLNHSWKVELYKDNNFQWDYETQINDVESGWTYSTFYPYYDNAENGSYSFKIYINTGSGYTLLDTKSFTVNGGTLANIVETAVADGRFTTLVAAVGAAGLADTLSNTNDLTVFAPTDDAFAKLPAGTVEALLDDIPTLSNILKYHVVAQRLTAEQVISAGNLTMFNGETAHISLNSEGVFINDSKIIITDIHASNGIIHVIDTVLTPPGDVQKNIVETAVADGRFTTLVAAIGASNFTETLSNTQNLTVFAPTDDAFAKLPAGTVDALLTDIPTLANILAYHVVGQELNASEVIAAGTLHMFNGDTTTITVNNNEVFINDSKIIITDIQTSNGIIHAIDTVLLPS